MEFERLPLIVTDGFEFYEKVVRRVFDPAVLYGQVLKTRRNDRIVQVEQRERMGASWRFEARLNNSEDSSTLNTSFIERMNLTIRQGSAYLSRRALSHARSEDKLAAHLELLRCHYNFIRPHGALRFGLRPFMPDSPRGASRSGRYSCVSRHPYYNSSASVRSGAPCRAGCRPPRSGTSFSPPE